MGEVEAGQGQRKEAGTEEKKSASKPGIAPGDFVIQSKEPGRQKKLAKDRTKAEKEKASFISVNVAKMDQLMDLIGELVITESVVFQGSDLKVPGLRLDNFHKAASQLATISTDLQNVIMSMRMMPLTNTFQRMNRLVFDVSRKLGKDIEFVMVGETTLILEVEDRKVCLSGTDEAKDVLSCIRVQRGGDQRDSDYSVACCGRSRGNLVCHAAYGTDCRGLCSH